MNVIEKPLLIKGYHGTIPDKVKLVCTQKENEYYFYGNILQFLEAINDKFIFLPTKDEETKKIYIRNCICNTSPLVYCLLKYMNMKDIQPFCIRVIIGSVRNEIGDPDSVIKNKMNNPKKYFKNNSSEFNEYVQKL